MAKKTSHTLKARPAAKRSQTIKKPLATHAATTADRPPGPRRLKRPASKTMRLRRRIHHPVKLPSAWWLTKHTVRTLWQHKKLFLGITAVYAILNLIFVQGFSNMSNLSALKTSLHSAFGGNAVTSGLTLFGVLISSSGSNTGSAGGYQLFLLLMASLAAIWALREVLAGSRIRVRDAYYRGMYPLVPFMLVLAVMCLQLIPLAIGAAVYNVVITNGIAVYTIEKLLWALLFGLLALLSLYMISSSVFALYIVTLPDMTPRRALRSARELVRNRRWTVLRKVLVLPVILLIVATAIMVPIILVLTPIAQWVFYVLTMFAVVVIHAYLYGLYRELLHE